MLDPAKLVLAKIHAYRVWNLTVAATEGKVGQGPAERPDQQTREAFGTMLVREFVGGKYEAAFRDARRDGTEADGGLRAQLLRVAA